MHFFAAVGNNIIKNKKFFQKHLTKLKKCGIIITVIVIIIKIKKEVINMKKFVCPCGYVYDPAVGDPDNGIAPGTPWEDVPESWECPICGLGKDSFEEK